MVNRRGQGYLRHNLLSSDISSDSEAIMPTSRVFRDPSFRNIELVLRQKMPLEEPSVAWHVERNAIDQVLEHLVLPQVFISAWTTYAVR